MIVKCLDGKRVICPQDCKTAALYNSTQKCIEHLSDDHRQIVENSSYTCYQRPSQWFVFYGVSGILLKGFLKSLQKRKVTIVLLKITTNKLIFFLSVFPFTEHLRITGQQGNGENVSNSSLSFLSDLDMSRGITAESLPLHIASDRIHTKNPCFPSAGR